MPMRPQGLEESASGGQTRTLHKKKLCGGKIMRICGTSYGEGMYLQGGTIRCAKPGMRQTAIFSFCTLGSLHSVPLASLSSCKIIVASSNQKSENVFLTTIPRSLCVMHALMNTYKHTQYESFEEKVKSYF